MSTFITAPQVAWLLYPVSVFSPVQKKRKVKFLDGDVRVGTGQCVTGTFRYSRGTFWIDEAGIVWDCSTGKSVMKGMSLVLTAKSVREMVTRSQAKWACNPNSETYRSM